MIVGAFVLNICTSSKAQRVDGWLNPLDQI
jgi:hypothetical protein